MVIKQRISLNYMRKGVNMDNFRRYAELFLRNFK